MALSDKQKRFIQEYVVDSNASAAYVRAGYSSKYPDKNASNLLKNKEIKSEIEKLQNVTAKKLQITLETSLKRQNNISLAYEELVTLGLKDKLTKYEEAKYGRLMMIVKAADSTRADEFLSKHLKWVDEDDNKSVDTSFTIKIVGKNKDGDK